MCAGTVACMKRFMKKCPWAQGATRGEQNISGRRLGRSRSRWRWMCCEDVIIIMCNQSINNE